MIIVEDVAHEQLIKSFKIFSRNILRAGNKFEVCKLVEKNSSNCIGLIDEDSDNQHPQPALLIKLKLSNHTQHQIKVYENHQKTKKIIVLCPIELEDWILRICPKSLDIKKEFGLETAHNDLHRVINNRLKQFENLVQFLIEQKNPAILHLRSHFEAYIKH